MIVDRKIKTKKEYKNLKKQEIQVIFKAYIQNDMDYEDFRDLPKRTVIDKVLRYKPFSIVENPKYDGYRPGIVSLVYKFLDEESSGVGIIQNQE